MELTLLSNKLAGIFRRSFLKPNTIKCRLLCKWRSEWSLHQITDYLTAIEIFTGITGIPAKALQHSAYEEYLNDFIQVHNHIKVLVGLKNPEGEFVAMYTYMDSNKAGFIMYLEGLNHGREEIALLRAYEIITRTHLRAWRPLPVILSNLK